MVGKQRAGRHGLHRGARGVVRRRHGVAGRRRARRPELHRESDIGLLDGGRTQKAPRRSRLHASEGTEWLGGTVQVEMDCIAAESSA